MNSIIRKIIGINVFKKTKDVKFMYNYNFDEVSDKVKSSVEDLVKEEEVGFVVSGLMTIMNKLGLSSSDDFNSQNSSCFAHLSLKNPIAFSKNDFESLVSWDKELCENMKVIDFQLNALNKQKQVALNNFEISRVVALVDMINLLELDKLKYNSEVENVNNKIAVIENNYNEDGSITVPEILRPYMGGIEKICQ